MGDIKQVVNTQIDINNGPNLMEKGKQIIATLDLTGEAK
jgi:hypothetical protein